MSSRLQRQATEKLPQQHAGLVELNPFIEEWSPDSSLSYSFVRLKGAANHFGNWYFCVGHPTWVPRRCRIEEVWFIWFFFNPTLGLFGRGRPWMPLCLTYNRRWMMGAQPSWFCGTFQHVILSWVSSFLEVLFQTIMLEQLLFCDAVYRCH